MTQRMRTIYRNGLFQALWLFLTSAVAFGQSVPDLLSASYLGGNREDRIHDVAYDTAGNIYLVGETRSPDFMVSSGVFQDQYDGFFLDGFITKLSPDGQTVLFSALLGGTDFDVITTVVIDADGNAIVGGYTASDDFPVTDGVVQASFGGKGDSALAGEYGDGFVARISADGTTLMQSTFLGGTGIDRILDLILDDSGRPVAVGHTDSENFPKEGAVLSATTGGDEAFISVLSADLSNLVFSATYGGSGKDRAYGLDLASGLLHIVGETRSEDLPLVDAVKDGMSGNHAGFWLTLDSSFQVLRSSYFGGDSGTLLQKVRVTDSGTVILAGETYAMNLPGDDAAYQGRNAGLVDAFVSVVPEGDSSAIRSTFLGSSKSETVAALDVDPGGRILVAGTCGGEDFPRVAVSGDPLQATYGGLNDGFLVMLSENLDDLIYASTLGGTWGEAIGGMALRPSGEVLLGGESGSEGLAMVEGAIQAELLSNPDGIFWRISAPPIEGIPIMDYFPREGGQGEVSLVLNGPEMNTVDAVRLVKADAIFEAVRLLPAARGRDLECLFMLHDAEPGVYDLVTVKGTAEERIENAFEVSEPDVKNLGLNLVAPRRVRTGIPELISITLTNYGNVDAVGSLVMLAFPGNAWVEPAFEWAGFDVHEDDTIDWDNIDRFATMDDMIQTLFHIGRVRALSRHTVRFWVTRIDRGEQSALAQAWSFPSEEFFSDLPPVGTRKVKTGASAHIIDCKKSILAAESEAYGVALPADCLWGTIRDKVMSDRLAARRGIEPEPISAVDLSISATMSCGADAAGVGDAFGAQAVLGAVNQAIKDCVLDESADPVLDGGDIHGSHGGGSNWGDDAADAVAELVQMVLDAIDPNEIVGITGFGDNHAIKRGRELTFEIHFENKAEAGLPAQVVTIDQRLDPTMYDLDTLHVESVQIGQSIHDFYLGESSGYLDIPLDDDKAIMMASDIGADGQIAFTLTTYDTETHEPTTDSLAGFLPPNVTAPEGQGVIRYRINLKEGLASNTLIANQASIVFDRNDPIETNVWQHVIDEEAPATTLVEPESPFTGNELTLEWASDDGIGAGARLFQVYVGRDGAEPELAEETDLTHSVIPVEDSENLEIMVTAVDWLGNEEIKTEPDASVVIEASDSDTADDDDDDDDNENGLDSTSGTGGDDGCGCMTAQGQAPAASLIFWTVAFLLLTTLRRRRIA